MKLNLMSKLRYESSMLKRNEMKWEIRCDHSTKTRTSHIESSSRDLELLFIGPYYHLASPYVRFHTSGTRWMVVPSMFHAEDLTGQRISTRERLFIPLLWLLTWYITLKSC